MATVGAAAGVVLVILGAALWWRAQGRATDDTAPLSAPTAVAVRAAATMPAMAAATARPTTASQTAIPAASATAALVTYTVRSGDSLWTISRALGVDLDALSAANPGATQRLAVGQQLTVPVTATPGGPSPTAPAPSGPSATPGPTAAPEAYTIRAGDTLGGVAAAHGLSVADLVAMNEGEVSGSEATLTPGQTLRVRQAAPSGLPVAVADMPFAAPWPLAPASGATVRDDAPLLRWVSAGILPEDVYYVVSLREADAAGRPGKEDLHWVRSNATALALPARYRPAPGSTRALTWSVTVRRITGRAPGNTPGEILCPVPEPRTFTWAP
jgi:LysM repeat protein